MPYELAQAELGGVAPELTGFSISPAVRFYPTVKKETPRGFYLEGFFKYQKNEIGLGYDLDINGLLDPNAPANTFPATQTYDFVGSVTATGGGIALGTQWLIGDRFSIDWKWLGAGIYKTTVGVDVAGNLPYDPALVVTSGGVTTDYNPKWADAEDIIGAELPEFPGVELSTSSTDAAAGKGSVGVSASTFTALPRFALTFGFAF